MCRAIPFSARAIPFSARALKKNNFFDVDIVVKKKQIKMWLNVVCTLIDNEYASDFPFKNFCKFIQHAETITMKPKPIKIL